MCRGSIMAVKLDGEHLLSEANARPQDSIGGYYQAGLRGARRYRVVCTTLSLYKKYMEGGRLLHTRGHNTSNQDALPPHQKPLGPGFLNYQVSLTTIPWSFFRRLAFGNQGHARGRPGHIGSFVKPGPPAAAKDNNKIEKTRNGTEEERYLPVSTCTTPAGADSPRPRPCDGGLPGGRGQRRARGNRPPAGVYFTAEFVALPPSIPPRAQTRGERSPHLSALASPPQSFLTSTGCSVRDSSISSVPLYCGKWRFGSFIASRRKGSPSSLVHMNSMIVGFPSFIWASTAFRRAGPTSSISFTVMPSAPIACAIFAKLGLSRFVPTYRSPNQSTWFFFSAPHWPLLKTQTVTGTFSRIMVKVSISCMPQAPSPE